MKKIDDSAKMAIVDEICRRGMDYEDRLKEKDATIRDLQSKYTLLEEKYKDSVARVSGANMLLQLERKECYLKYEDYEDRIKKLKVKYGKRLEQEQIREPVHPVSYREACNQRLLMFLIPCVMTLLGLQIVILSVLGGFAKLINK